MSARGFSLIELLVVLTVSGLLAAIALPGYSQVMNRALRQDARLAVLRVQHRQELYFGTHLSYAQRLPSEPGSPGLGLSARSEGGHYLVELQTAADGSAYTAIARVNPGGRQARDSSCAAIALDHNGARRSADATGLWNEDDPHRCWG